MKNIQRLILSVLLLMSSWSVLAQISADESILTLTKQGAHYVFSANINDKAEATILLESGISAMLVDSALVFSTGVFSEMELLPAEGTKKMNLAGRVYAITHRAKGKVKITDEISYVGEVLVLSQYAQKFNAAVPIQNLQNDVDDGSRIAYLNLSENYLQMISRASLRKHKKESSEYKMNTDTYLGMPAVETTVVVESEAKPRTLKGNFNIDFGNPELLFLLDQSNDVQKFFTENSDIRLHPARNPRGEVIGQYLIADQCLICGKQFQNVVIAMTANLPRFTTIGLIGLKFFLSTSAIFDFDKKLMYTL